MNRGKKELVVGILGIAGLVVLLLGLFTEAMSFGIGLVIAIAIWSLSGLLARYWDVPTWNERRQV